MLSSRLDRRITFLHAVVTDTDLGETTTWVDGATVWAAKQDVRDSERAAAAQVGATITTRFQVRRSSVTRAVTVKDRLDCDGLVYGISAIKEIGRREGYEITAAADVDGAES